MKRTLPFFIVVILFLFNAASNAQMGVTSYSIYSLGVNTSQDKKISLELKLFGNRQLDYLLSELDLFYNFEPGNYHRFSAGVGLLAAPFGDDDVFDAITVPVELEIYPLQDFKKVSLIFELAPEIGDGEDIRLRHLWGIRYIFGSE